MLASAQEMTGPGTQCYAEVDTVMFTSLPSLSSQVVNQTENACCLHGCVCKPWLKVYCIKVSELTNLKTW